MHSDDKNGPDSLHADDSKASLNTAPPVVDTSSQSAPTPLRREAAFKATERHRGALLAACCSLAGVAMGFGLSQMAAQPQNHCAHELRITPAAMASPGEELSPRGHATFMGTEVQSGEHLRQGALISFIVPGSPAEMANLRVGHTIVRLGDTQILSAQGLVRAVREQPIGQELIVTTIDPQGHRHHNPVTLGAIAPQDLRDLGY